MTVVVPTRDRPDALARCLAALERQTVDGFEVVVVDDRSRATGGGARGRWRARHAPASSTGEGRGPAAARNLGAACRGRRDRLLHRRRLPSPAPAGSRRSSSASTAAATVVAGPTLGPAGTDVVRARVAARHQPPRRRVASVRAARSAFAPTSNIACRRAVHARGAVRRVVPDRGGRGPRVVRPPARRSVTGIDFDADGVGASTTRRSPHGLFWRQHDAVRRRRVPLPRCASSSGPARSRLRLLRRASLRRAFADGVAIGVLVLVTQVATAVGLAAEAYRARRALKQWLARHPVDRSTPDSAAAVAATSSRRGGRDGVCGSAVPGTTSAHASPSVWLPGRPLPTPWRCTVPNSSERSPVKRDAGRSVQRTTRSGRRSDRLPRANSDVGDAGDRRDRRARRRDRRT